MARMACGDASREVLSRYLLLRNFNRTASSCRFVDLLGLMAAITLILAHLGGRNNLHSQHQDEASYRIDTLLLHQAPKDRAMMEQALKTMQDLSYSSQDNLCAQGAEALQRLLAIEASTNPTTPTANSCVKVDANSDSDTLSVFFVSGSAEDKQFFIPYFGVMQIVRPKTNECTGRKDARLASNDDGTQLGHSQAVQTADQYEFLPIDSYDEQWMSQSVDMNFLDAFLEGPT
jgi:hypothetical protein